MDLKLEINSVNSISLEGGVAEEVNPDHPRVLSCGGVNLKSGNLPLGIRQWCPVVHFPQAEGIRIYRYSPSVVRPSIKDLIKLEDLN